MQDKTSAKNSKETLKDKNKVSASSFKKTAPMESKKSSDRNISSVRKQKDTKKPEQKVSTGKSGSKSIAALKSSNGKADFNNGSKKRKTAMSINGFGGSEFPESGEDIQDKLIALKRKMHREIFERCLEKHFFANLTEWEDIPLPDRDDK